MAQQHPTKKTVWNELRRLISQARVPRIRTMRQFAEQEIILPDGPMAGRRFRCDRQPFSGLLFDAIDSGRWNRFVITGDQQSGKSLCGLAIPILYHLFEIRETVILAAPDRDIARDKWQQTLLPIIEKTRYREFLPRRGGGSRGGDALAYRLENGSTLRIMTGGGSDKSRAHFTSRVLCITETDGMDEAGGGSREADKISQLEGRTSAYGDRQRVYMECTVSIEEGRTWREYQAGTASRIVVPCPECSHWVTPEREHLIGWSDATDEYEARELGAFCCPECGVRWTQNQREQMNCKAQLLHRGQEITAKGKIKGEPPRTNTLGFRWTCFNNAFKATHVIAAQEYRASNDPDEDNAEKAMCQFWWATPYRPPRLSLENLTMEGIAQRQRALPKGVAPAKTTHIGVGIDLGMHICHWVATAFEPDGTPHIMDYGYLDVPSREMGAEIAILQTLRTFRDATLIHGWQRHGSEEVIVPSMVLVDAGYQQDVVLQFAAESKGILAAKGHGVGQYHNTSYRQPKSTGSTTALIGEGYHLALITANRRQWKLLQIDVDHWKTFVHHRLNTPIGEPGAMTLYQVAHIKDHRTYARQLLAEEWREEFRPGRGMVIKWAQIGRANHFFDATQLACVAGHIAGVRLDPKITQPPMPQHTRQARPQRRQQRPDAWRPLPLQMPGGGVS